MKSTLRWKKATGKNNLNCKSQISKQILKSWYKSWGRYQFLPLVKVGRIRITFSWIYFISEGLIQDLKDQECFLHCTFLQPVWVVLSIFCIFFCSQPWWKRWCTTTCGWGWHSGSSQTCDLVWPRNRQLCKKYQKSRCEQSATPSRMYVKSVGFF